ncbi:YqgQ family protein [Alteribacter aurantiacus]|uniref:YqgQ family protein n=1 Tax=Alteribacter aurantiacus TaxID=254410 RepID=UPI0004007194|nr:YqgQ family protein [Alteribacter aurantiacus]
MKNYYDILQLLKRFGTIIYTGDRSDDIELMEEELDELHGMNMIEKEDFIRAKLILREEKSRLKEK